MSSGVSDLLGGQATPQPARWSDYLAIARLDHAAKHVFIIPGIVLADLLRGVRTDHLLRSVLLGLVAAICIASANYVLNEWCDREFDRHHPTKSQRASVLRVLDGKIIRLEWVLLVAVGLVCAGFANMPMLFAAGLFAAQGVVYNVAPLRSKEKPYLDVISEAINNPLRLLIGWAMIDPTSLPPSSIILAYWFGGAFLMAAKRLSEYREIAAAQGLALLARYRASFAGYSELSLTASCFAYAQLSTAFLAIFLIKYRIEYILVLPIIITLFVYYLVMAAAKGSPAQNPERLYRARGLIAIVAVLILVFALATVVTIPALAGFATQHYILWP